MMIGKRINSKLLIFSLISILLIVLGLIYWFFKPEAGLAQSRNSDSQSQNVTENYALAMSDSKNTTLPTLSPSLKGTEIDCPIQVDANGNLVLTVGIRSCFDYFFSSLGEKTETELIADIRQYLSATLPASAAKYAAYLLEQYVGYMHTLQNAKPSGNFKTADVEELEKIINQMNKIQQQFFNAKEIEALFGNERNLNKFNIEQLRIHANKNLSTQQKAMELAKLIDQLPPTLADGVRVSMQFSELQQLTQEIKDKGGSPQELRSMRESLLGPEAADRLEKVDQEEAVWQSQVNNYLIKRDQILKSEMTDLNKQQAINQLRTSSFQSKEELLRAQSYEIMHDQKR